MTARLPLKGFRIVEFAEQAPGPLCGAMLADLGAEVLKVERPGGDLARGFPASFAVLNRGKRSVTLDLRCEDSRAIADRLVESADAVVVAFRPTTIRDFGLDFDRLAAINPSLVYCRITGYGNSSNRANDAAHDLCLLALSGLLDAIGGSNDTAERLSLLLLADLAAAHYAVIGIVAAFARRSAEAQSDAKLLDVPMSQSLGALLALPLASISTGRGLTEIPHYGLFEAAEGSTVALGLIEDRAWRRLCNEMDWPELADLSLDERIRRGKELTSRLGAAMLMRTAAEWEQALHEVGCVRVRCSTEGADRDLDTVSVAFGEDSFRLVLPPYRQWPVGTSLQAPHLGGVSNESLSGTSN